ncbi:phage major capsid protein [Streptomyces sp. SCA3-4]|uniref:phage major capsid protein n=1 Tax=Streptomyces sichuanensis TaxID=2871810 RepID=UPI001CE27315|nr:phage major capsid protein [Streptomyces sichuanensis]MCA6090951.1 phage major capsid protein [Streptomyces sichuanensis]
MSTAVAPIQTGSVPAQLLPPEITGPIFTKAVENSAVMQLARKVPLPLNSSTAIPIPGDVPMADWVDEGGAKPLGSSGIGMRKMRGKKVAVLVAVSHEVAMTNAAGLYEQLQHDLPTALGRAFDRAAIHGKTMSGARGPFEDCLTATPNAMTLGTTAQAKGGIYADLVTGTKLVAAAGHDTTGFIADPLLKPEMQLATDTTGRPIFVQDPATPGTVSRGTLIGYPIAYNRGVGGKLARQSTTADTGLRAIAGDWDQAIYGSGMDITIKSTDVGTYVDADGHVHSAFQENLILLLAEAHYGFAIGDVNAFVTYAAPGATPAPPKS